MGILLVRLIDVINEYSEDSTFYSIAYTMLLNFDNLQNLSINDVANLCHVSKSTISKFVRSLNFEDYSDFKAEAYFKENRFNNSILQRMKSNNTKPASVIQKINHSIQRISQYIQFPVQFNTNCLECSLGRMS